MRMLILSIRLRAEQLQGLEKFAKERHLSVGWCIRAAVDEWLKKNAKNETNLSLVRRGIAQDFTANDKAE